MASDNQKYLADFEFIREHVSQFFDRGAIQRSLDLIHDVGITGWEKWWQVEFVSWLSEHHAIGEWVMEEPFFTDLRRDTQKNKIAIDLGFRMKGFSTKEMLFLELKQDMDWRRCIENMLKDIEKVYTAQTYSIDNKLMIRNFFVVGIYPTGDMTKKLIHDYIERRAEELNIPLERGHLFTKFVQNTPFSVTAF